MAKNCGSPSRGLKTEFGGNFSSLSAALDTDWLAGEGKELLVCLNSLDDDDNELSAPA